MFSGKSRQHAASVSIILNLETNLVPPNFHIVHEDDFEIVASNANNMTPNWREIFDFNDYVDDE